MVVRLLFIDLNWRSNLSKPALCCNRQAEVEWAEETACLREPMFALVLAHYSPLVGCCRGVFCKRLKRSHRGIKVAVVCLDVSGEENLDADLTRDGAIFLTAR